ncbi:site-specific recombination directionality factor RDF [Mycobacterium phage DroogsArmy]|uniref:RDF protein n=2 Tax=Timshelvirus TaxID=2948926 RepID=G1DB93_9CAUD|nr:site-specific recombination directionality factor RDF [Mycobacterium phage Timshel]YP_010062028.1 site-specific recombination directionality factor RDF [Mycobacterium phage DroogsArmy]AEJ92359.1 hypothetical protein TIMSHEL_75 [Mycobacterium phage Timshel]QKO02470.1 hypothetical protein SEA_DROOGSARMY_74 [Mycobacterium phage DroogsArmy]
MIKTWLIALAMAASFTGLGLVTSGQAQAAPSAECAAHLAGKQTAITPSADRRYHLERGEFSPCNEEDAGGSSSARRDDHPQEDDEQKTRFCRKRWYC